LSIGENRGLFIYLPKYPVGFVAAMLAAWSGEEGMPYGSSGSITNRPGVRQGIVNFNFFGKMGAHLIFWVIALCWMNASI